jgi:hypothetical protein
VALLASGAGCGGEYRILPAAGGLWFVTVTAGGYGTNYENLFYQDPERGIANVFCRQTSPWQNFDSSCAVCCQ